MSAGDERGRTGAFPPAPASATVPVMARQPQSIADATPLPDWAGRKHWIWQVFDRAWRPVAHWNVVIGVGYVCWGGHAFGRPMDEPYATLVLLFAGGVIWNKTFEKLRGVS